MKYLIKLECVIELEEQNIEDLANAQLTEALCHGLRDRQAVFAKPSPDHIGDRSVSILDGSMSDVERRAKRLRRKVKK